MGLFKFYIVIFILLLASCRTSTDEERIGQRLETNNEFLEKQSNLLKHKLDLALSQSARHQAVRSLKRTGELSLALLDQAMPQANNKRQFEALLHEQLNRFNDSLQHHSNLSLQLNLNSLKSQDALLLKAWKKNNRLMFEIRLWESCLKLYEIKSQDATAYMRPVVMTKTNQKLQEGGSAIFDIAFKSRKTESTRIEIMKVTVNGKAIAKNSIEVDRHTQRFIVHSLKRGLYQVEGSILVTNDLGEEEVHVFLEKFRIP